MSSQKGKQIKKERMEWEFISLASHELRTPLSAIQWFTEILLTGETGELDVQQREFVNMIRISNKRMIHLVNLLLKVSRVEMGRIIIDPRPTHLGELFDEVLAEFANQITIKRHTLRVDADKDLPLIKVDPVLVKEVYINLLSNAIKYTDFDGEISVRITNEKEYILSEVKDTGRGIPEKEQKQVFEKFFRASNTRQVAVEEGSGLGLYLSKRVVELSGGTIGFTSKLGEGATFWFRLPIGGSHAQKGEVSLIQ